MHRFYRSALHLKEREFSCVACLTLEQTIFFYSIRVQIDLSGEVKHVLNCLLSKSMENLKCSMLVTLCHFCNEQWYKLLIRD